MSTNFVTSAFSDWFSAFGTGATIFGVGFTIGGAVALRNRNALVQTAKQEAEVAVGKADAAEVKAEAAQNKADAAQQKFDDLKTVLDGEVDLWLRESPEDMRQILRNISQSIPIITVCNFKGGVGKTTLSANLAAYFQHQSGSC